MPVKIALFTLDNEIFFIDSIHQYGYESMYYLSIVRKHQQYFNVEEHFKSVMLSAVLDNGIEIKPIHSDTLKQNIKTSSRNLISQNKSPRPSRLTQFHRQSRLLISDFSISKLQIGSIWLFFATNKRQKIINRGFDLGGTDKHVGPFESTAGYCESGELNSLHSDSVYMFSCKTPKILMNNGTGQYFFVSWIVFSQQAEHFCNSIGIIQQTSKPSKFPGFERIGTQSQIENGEEDFAQLFATLISR